MYRSRFSFLPSVLALLMPMSLRVAEGDGGGAADPAASGAAPAATPPVVDADAIRQAAQADFARQLKETTGFSSLDEFKAEKLKQDGKLQELADQHAATAETYKSKFQKTAIDNAILAASADAVDPSVINSLLAGKAVCDDDGKVTIDGKPVAEAVKALLAEKTFLAKAQGGTGSGAGQNLGGGKVITRAELNKMTAVQSNQFFADGGKVTD